MYICPTCQREFNKEDKMVKHLSICWKEQHPFHQSKPAPRGIDKETRQVNDDILKFFERIKNG